MIVYCTTTYESRMEQTKECIRRIAQFGTFDRMVVIASNSPPYEVFSNESSNWLLNHGCEVYERLWNDNFPEMRNAYIDKCQIDDWIVVSDADEWFNEEFCKDVREITERAEKDGYQLLLINVHDITNDKEGKGEEVPGSLYKNLIFRKCSETKYAGVGETNVHETLLPSTMATIKIPPHYYYLHVKEWHEVWERAARNVVAGGGGNNVGEMNEQWIVLKEIMKELNLKHWPALRDYLIKGIPEEPMAQPVLDTSNPHVKMYEWLIRNRRMGYDWENEMCDMFRWYFEYLHPEQNYTELEVITDQIPERAEIMTQIEELYLELLERHADSPGKQMYTRMVEIGEATLEEVRGSIMASSEYQAKHPTDVADVIPLSEKVQFDVNMIVTEDVIRKNIIEKSTIFQDRFATPLRLGRKWRALLAITRKEESDGRGIDETPEEEYLPFIQQFKSLVSPDEYNFVLDVGAGAGLETHLLEQEGYTVQGITFGQDNINRAKEEYGIHLLEMDMHDLMFSPGVFDATFSIQTFEHAFAPWLHILEMRRVLRNGGRVYIDCPDPNDQAMLETIWHVSVLYPNQIKTLFGKAGFKLIADFSKKHRQGFVFEKMPDDSFEMWSYIKIIMTELEKV